MRNRRKNDSLLCALVAFALVLNSALPFFALGKLPQPSAVDKLYGDKILICTSDGFKFVDKDKVFGEQHVQKKHCQFCYFNAAFQPGTPSAPQIATAVSGGVISKSLFGFGGQQLQNQLLATNHSTRAPPYFV